MNPFPGLRPFLQDEDYLFFGREEQTMELLQRLGNNRFVAVVGTSGSGKSSLVRCGLLSELLGGKMLRAGASWEIAVTHPGGNPLALLTEALLEADLYDREEADVRERVLATLSRSHFGLVEAVKQARLGDDVNFLLVVDQFEEIFRFNDAGQTQQEVANEFVSILLEAVSQSVVPIYVVLTMRSDFIGDCGQFEGLAEMVNRGEFLIPRLSREQYKRVIEAPIKVAGGQIAPRLLQRLLNDLGQQADQLPCLQHALMRTWTIASERDGDQLLDLEDYQRIGKMSHALSLHANEVYESLASDRQRELCAGIFQAMTVQESENRGIRRPQRLETLCRIVEAKASELIPVIDAFRQHGITFLMPPPEVELERNTIIDISHESLMRVWTRLRHWVEEEAQAARIYRRLSESAALFEQGKAGLYRDPELGIALSWRESRGPNEAWAVRYHGGFAHATEFLNESQAAAEKSAQERDAALQHELQQAKRLAEAQRLRAEEQKRAAVRLRWLVGAIASVAAVALGAFVMAANARVEAEQNEWRAVAAQSRAVAAAKTAEEALVNMKLARDAAESAGERERIQREVAETQTAVAVRAQKQLKAALYQAETARQEAENAKMLAEVSQRKAEASQGQAEAAQRRAEVAQRQAVDDRKRAEAAERQAVQDRKLAEREKLLAERSAELARRREKLFEKLLPLLQEHASEGVLKFARKLQDEGKPREALDSFLEFADLVLGEQQAGFVASELLDLDAFDLEGLDSETIGVEISVPPLSLFTDVLMPAIALGEQELTDDPDEQLQRLVAMLHTYRARVLKQHPNERWPAGDSVARMIFESFDRAAALEPERFEHFLGRAVARFRLPDRDLSLAFDDLNTAISLYPDPPEPVGDDENVTDRQRRFAQLQHAKGNLLEYLADNDRTEKRSRLLSEAEQSHRQARSLDPREVRYLVGVARSLRKQLDGPNSSLPITDSLDLAEKLLAQAIELKPESPETHNELGEILLAQGRIADSRKAFESAVNYGKQRGRKRGLYVAYCNLANSYARDPTNRSGYERALRAAESAIALQTDTAVEGQYNRGFALWKLGRTSEALEALSDAIEIEPKYVDALLARCQIVFEMKDPDPPTDDQLRQAYADAPDVLGYPNLTKAERAKAHYVNSLAWLKRHVQQRSEESLVKCQGFAVQAAEGSSAYFAFAKQISEYAAGLAWKDGALRQESERLQARFEAIADANAAGSD